MKHFIKKIKSCITVEYGASAVFALLLIGCVIVTTSSLLLSASSIISTVKSKQNTTNYSSAVNSAIKLFREEIDNLNYSASYTMIIENDEEEQETESYLSEDGFTDNVTGAGHFETIITDMLRQFFNPESPNSDESTRKSITAVYLISITPNETNI